MRRRRAAKPTERIASARLPGFKLIEIDGAKLRRGWNVPVGVEGGFSFLNYLRLFSGQKFSTLKADEDSMSSFSDLPTELATDILAIAIPQHPVPGSILAVNRCFNDIGQFIIYTSLRFKSESQLVKFALKRRFRLHHNRGHHPHRSHHRQKGGCWGRNSDPALTVSATFSGGACKICGSGTSDTVDKKILPHFPRSISVRIPGGHGGGIVFEGIKHVFQFCADAVGAGVLALDSLEFCLNSHARDLAPWRIGEALSLVKYVPSSLVLFGTHKPTWYFRNFIHQPTPICVDRTGLPVPLLYSGSCLIRPRVRTAASHDTHTV